MGTIMKIPDKKKLVTIILLEIIIYIICMIPSHSKMYYEEKKMETEKYTAVFYSCTYYHKILKDEPYGPDTHICESGVIIRLFHCIFVYTEEAQLVTL